MNCWDKETVVSYLSGDLEVETAQAFAAHVVECTGCKILLDDVSALIDQVRQDLLLVDPPLIEEPLSPLFVIKKHPAIASSRPVTPRLRGLAARAVVIAFLVITIFGLYYLVRDREVVSADEILRRAAATSVSARTVPDRIVFRHWKETLKNGLGPLPDGNYTTEYWWDNRHNLAAIKRFDEQQQLVQGNWLLKDGVTIVVTNYDGRSPEVTTGPADNLVVKEIENLPDDVREQVRAYFRNGRRPFIEVASDLQMRQEREITSSLAGTKPTATAREEMTSDGKKAYRVTSVTKMPPESPVDRWEANQLILAQSYTLIDEKLQGFRRDGKVYEKSRTLLGEEAYEATEDPMKVFSPVSFPKESRYRQVSPGERVSLFAKQALRKPDASPVASR